MVSPVPPGPNLYDSGAITKPSVNAQPSNNQRLEMQEMSRNIESARPQAAAGAAPGRAPDRTRLQDPRVRVLLPRGVLA